MRTLVCLGLGLCALVFARPCAAQQNAPVPEGAPVFDSQHATEAAPAIEAAPVRAPTLDAAPATEAASVRAPVPDSSLVLHRPDGKRSSTRFRVADDSSRADLTLYLLQGINPVLSPGGSTASGEFVPLCRAPCEFSLRSGTHLFGVAASNKNAVKLDRELHVKRGENVVVRYRSRIWHRVGGWILLLGGVSAGSVLLVGGATGDQSGRVGMQVGGAVLTTLSLVGGLWLANLPDRATGWVVP